jgi:hypothetical protein
LILAISIFLKHTVQLTRSTTEVTRSDISHKNFDQQRHRSTGNRKNKAQETEKNKRQETEKTKAQETEKTKPQETDKTSQWLISIQTKSKESVT